MPRGVNKENPPLEGNDWLVHISVMKEKGSLFTIPFHHKKQM
jgi:hypothetical protein